MGQIWNPWHGCHKISTGCSQCYVFREDAARGVSSPTTEVRKTSSFNFPLKKDRYGKLKFPSGTHFWLCFTSDLFIEEADCWRDEIWSIIRSRQDCHFTFFTKRIHRMKDCLPCDWNDGWSNITIGCSVENQINAEKRLPIFLALPIKHRLIVAAPLLEGIDLKMWLDPNLIESVSVGGESGKYARALDFAWVEKICRQCRDAGIDFSFHQTGSYLLKDGRKYHIPRNIQHSQAEKALEYLKNII